MVDREQTRRDAPTGIVAELREWKRRALEAEHSLEQAERERDDLREQKRSRGGMELEARLAKVPALVEANKKNEARQREALALCEQHGFVFDDIGAEPGNWQHLAFTFYTMLCEVQSESADALAVWEQE